jgi:hypothetical protein
MRADCGMDSGGGNGGFSTPGGGIGAIFLGLEERLGMNGESRAAGKRLIVSFAHCKTRKK